MTTRKEKFNIAKAGISTYVTCSVIAYFKEGGVQFFANADAWTIKINKTLGLIDVVRLDGHLQNMSPFGEDWLLYVLGFCSTGMILAVMKLFKWIGEEGKPAKKGKLREYKIASDEDFQM